MAPRKSVLRVRRWLHVIFETKIRSKHMLYNRDPHLQIVLAQKSKFVLPHSGRYRGPPALTLYLGGSVSDGSWLMFQAVARRPRLSAELRRVEATPDSFRSCWLDCLESETTEEELSRRSAANFCMFYEQTTISACERRFH